mmetsp:Transcript_1211/g.2678  ORF Transcript_1211/g.2678 Transcript_1211/m.2678 type:complete len:369 (+) Transcript_1211:37-1143(+)
MPKKISAQLKQKIVDDKTFGMKNKKGAKGQQYVQQVQAAVDAKNKPKSRLPTADDLRKQEKESKKEFQKELVGLFKPVQQTKVPQGADPKSVICEFFKQGLCGKGAKCKFSHNLATERKAAKINVYEDIRDEGMDNWDQSTLESAVQKKMNKVQTDIICKFFIEAVETKKYGWFWNCPNGEKCIYRHALPPGYVLKSDAKKMDEAAAENQIPIEEAIECQRKALPTMTPVTLESFLEWKRRKKERQAVAAEQAAKDAKAKADAKPSQMSGRALFTFNPDLFVDDDEAAEELEREEDEFADVVEINVTATSIGYTRGAQGGSAEEGGAAAAVEGAAAGGGAAAIQANLFLEEELPDDLDLDDDDEGMGA